jgi:organic hydroperoxide reductase OsmC/OhrA
MSLHTARIHWTSNGNFSSTGYSRDHQVTTGSGVAFDGTSAPQFGGAEDRANPEELLVAAVSSCHMLTFLALCARRNLIVASYTDDASGELGRNAAGRTAVIKVTLKPTVRFEGTAPTAEQLDALHHKAHEHCFIAQSLTCEVETFSPTVA